MEKKNSFNLWINQHRKYFLQFSEFQVSEPKKHIVSQAAPVLLRNFTETDGRLTAKIASVVTEIFIKSRENNFAGTSWSKRTITILMQRWQTNNGQLEWPLQGRLSTHSLIQDTKLVDTEKHDFEYRVE